VASAGSLPSPQQVDVSNNGGSKNPPGFVRANGLANGYKEPSLRYTNASDIAPDLKLV
jgi:hypothetical protein